MKTAISATGDNLNVNVEEQFGRCSWFLFVDLESLQFEAVENKNADAVSGAGTACAQLVLKKGVDAVIAGKVGPNAYEALKQGGLKIFIAPQNISIQEAIDKCKKNKLEQMEMKVF